MSQRQLHHLLDQGQLFTTSTDVVVSNSIQGILFFLAFDWLSFAVDDCVWCDDAEGRGVRFYHFEFDSPHTTANDKSVVLMDGSVSFQKVGLEIHLKPVACEAFDRVIDGQDVDPFAIFDVRASGDGDNVAQTDSQVVSHDSGKLISKCISFQV